MALILIAITGFLSCAILSLAYSWKLGVVMILAGLPPMSLSGYFRIRLEADMDQKIGKQFSMSSSIASEVISAIRTVSSLAKEESVLENYTAELDYAIANSVKFIYLINIAFAFTQSIEYAFLALGFFYGCRLVASGELSMVNFFVAFLGVYFSGQQASIMFGFLSSLTKATNTANYIFWLEKLQPTIQENDQNRSVRVASK